MSVTYSNLLKRIKVKMENVKANIKGMSHTTCLCCIFSLSQKVCLYVL